MKHTFIFKKAGRYYGAYGIGGTFCEICIQFVVARMGYAPQTIKFEISNEKQEGWTEIFLKKHSPYYEECFLWGASKDRIRGGLLYSARDCLMSILSPEQREMKATSIWIKLTDISKKA
jgi:hypothetical protein